MNRSLSGIRFRTGNQDTQEEQATIEINGTYYKYIVHFPNVHDYFEGNVVISDIDMTAKEMLWTVFLSDYPVTYDKGGTLAYLNSGPLGYIFEKDNFSQVIIEISEEDGNDSIYVFPANDKAEAVEEYSFLWGNTNFTTEAEPETKKLELSIDITDYYQTDKEGVSNHYYIDENHVLWGTGENKDGQLGLPEVDLDMHEEPVKIAENVVHFDFSQDGLLIYVTEEHQLYGLGEASFGIFPEIHKYEEKQLFQDEYAQVTSPVLLMEDVAYAVCGNKDIAILKTNSQVWIQGLIWMRYQDQYEYVPEAKKVLEGALLITGGIYNHAALLKDGTVWTWGYNYAGNCGVAEKDMVSSPEKAAEDCIMVWTDFDRFENQKVVAQFEDNTMIQKSDGSYWVCGANIGDEKKVLPQYYEVSDYECVCTSEFLKYSME